MLVTAHLPLSWSQAMGAGLGRLILRFNKKRRLIAKCNINACFPQLSATEQHNLMLKSAREYGKWLLESPYVWLRNAAFLRKKIRIYHPEVLQAAFDKGKGVVIILPHLGNFELINFYVPFHYPFGALYKPVKSRFVEHMVRNGRSRVGTAMFSTNTRGVRGAFKHLKQGGVLLVLPDHLPSKNTGVFAPFFGIPAHTGKLTQSLVTRNHSEVVLASVLRLPQGQGFELEFYPIQGIAEDDPITAATALNQAMEKAIRLCPEQYPWFYRRFSRQPQGWPNLYDNPQ